MNDGDEGRAVGRWRGGGYGEALAEAICARTAAGESLAAICREPGMPACATVRGWMRARPDFAARVRAGRAAGGMPPAGGRVSTYDPQVGAAICERLAMGMALARACEGPGMPAFTTVFNWIRAHEDFAKAYAKAREIQAHYKFDQVWDVAERATPKTAYLAKVRIDALKWQTARLAPTKYGAKPDPEADEGLTVVIRKFFDPRPEEGGEAA